MLQNTTDNGWVWTPERERAAERVAGGWLKRYEIAAEAGVSRMQLWRWEQVPAFWARVVEHRVAYRERMRRETEERMDRMAAEHAARMARWREEAQEMRRARRRARRR